MSWDEEQILFAGNRLAFIPAESRPMKIFVRTEKSFLNVAASLGVSVVGGILGPLLFVPWRTEVTAWTEG